MNERRESVCGLLGVGFLWILGVFLVFYCFVQTRERNERSEMRSFFFIACVGTGLI